MNINLRHSHLVAAIGFIVLVLMLLHAGYSLAPAVTHDTSTGIIMQHQLWLDDIPRSYGSLAGRSGIFQATLNRPPSGALWLENTFGAEVILSLNDETVYQGSESAAIVLPDGENFRVELRYEMPGTILPRSRLGLMQRGLFGQDTVQPAWDFVPPSTGQDIARTGFWLCLAISILLITSALRLPRQKALILLALWGLSLAVHGFTMNEKLNNSDAHWSMDNTWDNYVVIGRDWTQSRATVVNQEMQVANFVYMGIAQIVLEPDVTTLYGVNTLIASAVPVLLALASWSLFRRWTTGILTGVMAILFMPLVHFGQTLQPEGVANVMLALLLCSVVMLYRRSSPIWVLLCGLLVGVCTILRGSWVLLILWVGLIILFSGVSWRRKIAYILLTGVAAAAVMFPLLYTNFSNGVYLLTPTRSEMQTFRANGLDSLGLASYQGISEQLMVARGSTFKDWNRTLREDIQRDPLRLVELTLRRLGLIWQSEEHGDADQVDYEKFSLSVSPTTQLFSLNGNITSRTLLVLATVALIFGLAARRREIGLLIPPVLVWIVTLMAFFALARFRIGMAIFLLPPAAYGFVQAWDFIREGSVRRLIFTLILAAVINGAILYAADWMVENLPRPQLVTENEFPASFVPVRGDYGGEIRLRGYANYESNYQSGGYVIFELFWQALQKPSEDYVVTFRLVNTATGEIESVQNFTQGMNTAPEYKSTAMNPGEILFERYLIRLPDETPRSYAIFVGLYSTSQETVLPLSETTAESQGNHLRVTAVQLRDAMPEPEFGQAQAVWHGKIAQIDGACLLENGTLQIHQSWQIIERVSAEWRYFIHVYQGDTFLVQQDGRLDEANPPDALPVYARLETTFTLPDAGATDNVRAGFYNPADTQRIPITASDTVSMIQDDTLRLECKIR